jgi:hypothetical protein
MNQPEVKNTIHPDLARLTEIEQQLMELSAWIPSAQILRNARAPYLVSGEKLILSFAIGASDTDRAFYRDAPKNVRFLLDFASRAIRHAREQGRGQKSAEPVKATGDFAAECGMKCDEAAFRAFLVEKHGLAPDATDDDVSDCVRKALKIKSRSELNAAGRWFAMRAEFQLWERHG